jgi:hypothetical protein
MKSSSELYWDPTEPWVNPWVTLDIAALCVE